MGIGAGVRGGEGGNFVVLGEERCVQVLLSGHNAAPCTEYHAPVVEEGPWCLMVEEDPRCPMVEEDPWLLGRLLGPLDNKPNI
jgi:hypothetical protein